MLRYARVLFLRFCYFCFLFWFLGWGGVGWDDNVHLHFSQTWCYATVGRLAFFHRHDATRLSVVLHFLTDMMLRYCLSSCISSQTWCYATVCRLVFPHRHDATLLSVVLYFLTYLMLRYCRSSCISSQTWCYATVCRLAFPHRHDATLLSVSYISSHSWCYATVCRLAFPHRHDATLLSVVLYFLTDMNATSKVAGHTVMSEDIKAMVDQWVFRQSLGPITPIAFLEELKRLLKQWGKKDLNCCFAVVWVKPKLSNVKKHWVFS